MTPIALIGTILLVALMLLLPRKYAIAPLLLAACFFSMAAKLSVGPSAFPTIRILVLAGVVRTLLRGEIRSITANKLDAAVVLYSILLFVAYFLQTRSIAAANYISGVVIDILGTYYVCRALVQSWDDVVFYLKFYAVVTIPIALEMVYENVSHYNLFSYLGARETSYIREGRYRCEAAFGHPILAGTFGAIGFLTTLSLYFRSRNMRALWIVAMASGLTIALTSASSGAVLTVFFGVVGWTFWFIRDKMRWVRRGIVVALLTLHLAMKAPVWYLIAKLSGVFGGTGWHRAYLIDQAIRYFGDWWLIGTTNTGNWMPYTLSSGNSDITNQFLAQGVRGGLFTMLLYIAIVVGGYKCVGRGLSALSGHAHPNQFVAWGLGCALLGHTAAFFSVSYFDQSKALFSILLAALACVGVQNSRSRDDSLSANEHSE